MKISVSSFQETAPLNKDFVVKSLQANFLTLFAYDVSDANRTLLPLT